MVLTHKLSSEGHGRENVALPQNLLLRLRTLGLAAASCGRRPRSAEAEASEQLQRVDDGPILQATADVGTENEAQDGTQVLDHGAPGVAACVTAGAGEARLRRGDDAKVAQQQQSKASEDHSHQAVHQQETVGVLAAGGLLAAPDADAAADGEFAEAAIVRLACSNGEAWDQFPTLEEEVIKDRNRDET
eukprot:CAMPEP_0177323734 /NCGR_PEP_ID=MMETSP0368-20130122/16902_1 /TAXON_ID=447022 ORGANISM="Scrippsiella hangoei-like, Strain SHHI-4" /NCGR_SAMPLE_ID=MMETSP0368 /ASSEMBLY_ACC=CAM_ASM_000363 /LENGTH=188 /DNA_ID=CAMNT_0018783523 /DNA_START=97 /DNA_END=665 /DNA_ORIENTATION=-